MPDAVIKHVRALPVVEAYLEECLSGTHVHEIVGQVTELRQSVLLPDEKLENVRARLVPPERQFPAFVGVFVDDSLRLRLDVENSVVIVLLRLVRLFDLLRSLHNLFR